MMIFIICNFIVISVYTGKIREMEKLRPEQRSRLRLYNAVLTSDDIATLYHAGDWDLP
jgi:hypothetical protein